MIVIKREDAPVVACRLGDGSELEKRLIASGALRRLPDGRYEVFSREAVNTGGELAEAGSYVKVDHAGFPYPNSAEFFLANHVETDGGYVQRSRPREAWQVGQPVSDAVRFLLDSGRLTIDRQNPDRYFSAQLWGTLLSARQDAVIVFYEIRRTAEGRVADAQFSFVAREEFDRNYDILENGPAQGDPSHE